MDSLKEIPLKKDTATGYCFKCKAKREFKVLSEKDAKNKKNKIKQGKCSLCNGNISTIAGSRKE